ncbi:MAG: glycosyltransferase family 4 protein [Verrucomicrobia bacterium]|nr:glycosyltransferase family 4 protein [Verrucomicrobiota bacterium]
MRILIVTKYYFVKGGPERYLFNLTPVLESHGHTVVPLALRFDRNRPSPYTHYFLDPPAGAQATGLEQFRIGLKDVARMVVRAFYWPQARGRVREVIRREKIDLVYMLNISNYISPSIIDGAHAEGVPAVHRVNDFHLVCPNALLMRSSKDRCMDCFPGKYWHGIAHRCVGGSLGASAVRSASMFFHDLSHIYRRVDSFVCTNPFMRDVLARRGFDQRTLHMALTPIDASSIPVGEHDDGSLVYFGRLSREKGVDLLVEAASQMRNTSCRVFIVGEVSGEYAQRCVAQAARCTGTRIEFLGPRHGEDLFALIRSCRATIMPSRCIDNLPNALLESFACGKPVVGADVEGIRVVVRDGENGLLFRPGDAADLARKLDALAADPDRARQLGLAGRRLVEQEHSPERHYESLMRAFEAALARRVALRRR